MNDKPKMGYHVGQKLFDEYVCKIASALEVNEKCNKMIIIIDIYFIIKIKLISI